MWRGKANGFHSNRKLVSRETALKWIQQTSHDQQSALSKLQLMSCTDLVAAVFF